MSLCSSVSRVSGQLIPATASAHQPVSTSTSRQSELLCSSAYFLKISTPKLGIYTSKPYICPVGHKNSRPSAHRQISTFAHQRAQLVMSAARERKIARFFCTPQRAGIQRVTPVSREIPENFSKISSPKIWCVCQKSVPLHSQIRNEAYNTSQI